MATARQRGIRAVATALVLILIGALLSTWLGQFVLIEVEPQHHPERVRRDLAMAWVARLLLLLAGAWIAIGMIATRTTLVRRPGAAAARSTWLASTRPWRARESMLGLLGFDRALLIIVPAGLLLATCAVQTSFLLPWPIVLICGAYALFGLITILCIPPRSPWPAIAAIGGVVVAQCVLVLVGSAIAGPNGFWVALWTEPALRTVVFAAGLALVLWTTVAAGGAMRTQVGRRRATGIVLTATGTALSVPFLVVALIGPNEIGAAWDDRVVALSLPEPAVWIGVALGLALILSGLLTAGRRPPADPL